MAGGNTEVRALLGTVIQNVIGHILVTGNLFLSTGTGKHVGQIISIPPIAQRLEQPFLVMLEDMVTNLRA